MNTPTVNRPEIGKITATPNRVDILISFNGKDCMIHIEGVIDAFKNKKDLHNRLCRVIEGAFPKEFSPEIISNCVGHIRARIRNFLGTRRNNKKTSRKQAGNLLKRVPRVVFGPC